MNDKQHKVPRTDAGSRPSQPPTSDRPAQRAQAGTSRQTETNRVRPESPASRSPAGQDRNRPPDPAARRQGERSPIRPSDPAREHRDPSPIARPPSDTSGHPTPREVINMPGENLRPGQGVPGQRDEVNISRNARDVQARVDSTLVSCRVSALEAANDFSRNAIRLILNSVPDPAARLRVLKGVLEVAGHIASVAPIGAAVGRGINVARQVTDRLGQAAGSERDRQITTLDQAAQQLTQRVRDAYTQDLETTSAELHREIAQRSITDDNLRQTLRGTSPDHIDQALRRLGINSDAPDQAYRQVRAQLEAQLGDRLAFERFVTQRTSGTDFNRMLAATPGTDLNRQFQQFRQPYLREAEQRAFSASAQREHPIR